MSGLSDRDWELVNGWADGELSAAEKADFAARLKVEPDLVDALASIEQASSALAALHPANDPPETPANTVSRPWLWASLGALAASVVIAAATVFAPSATSSDHIHWVYAAQNFERPAVTDTHQVAGTMIDGFPTLTEANLTLVVTNLDSPTASAHYLGVNGCRLTVLRGTGPSQDIPKGLQAAEWRMDDIWFQAVASGMDQQKFDAVTRYLQQATERLLRQDTVAALQGAVRQSAPCA